ncbi:MAG: carbohydrate ABC transporter permease [Bariatricus sp.]
MKKYTICDVLRHSVLIIFASIILFPFLWMFFASFKEEQDVFVEEFHLLPTHWRAANYIDAWNAAPFGTFFVNSLNAAVISVSCQTVFCSMAAYAFAKMEFPFKKALFSLMLAMLILPEEAAIIPNYLLAQKLNLINTSLGVAMMQLVNVFNIFLMRQIFMAVPDDLLQSASLDGCNSFQTFWHIVLPNAKSSIATVALLSFLNSWNNYMWPYMVTDENRFRTLQIGLRYLIRPDLGPQWPMIMAASTLILIPVMLLFVFLQKYFVQGMLTSGIK